MSKFKGTEVVCRVVHSYSKTAFNIIGTVLGGKYKIARIPYIVVDDMPKHSEKQKAEAELHANLFAHALNLAQKHPDFHNWERLIELGKAVEAACPEVNPDN